MKKHIAWYIKGTAGASQWRDRIFRAEATETMDCIITRAFAE
jgi:tRNA-dihydrouridine synthase